MMEDYLLLDQQKRPFISASVIAYCFFSFASAHVVLRGEPDFAGFFSPDLPGPPAVPREHEGSFPAEWAGLGKELVTLY